VLARLLAFFFDFFPGGLVVGNGCVCQLEPTEKMVPGRIETANAGLDAVGNADKEVVSKQLRNVAAVIGQVLS
jgi:hypothetical protein